MVVGESAPVWSNLGQTGFHPRRLPGARSVYCPSDAFEESCQDPNNPYGGSSMELFGLGQGVLFPEVSRPDYAVNPLSGEMGVPGFERTPGYRMMYDNASEVFGLGQARIPDQDELRGLGMVRIPDGESLGQGLDLKSPDIWVALAATGMIAGSFWAKGNVKEILRGIGIVVGGISATNLVAKMAGK